MPQPLAKNWIAVTPSRFPWEQEALDFIHGKFPAGSDYLAWSNFEFIASDGSINETDLLIATLWGVFLVEIKSRPGRISGDNGTWTWFGEDGGRYTDENPILLTNRECKRLKDLLGRQAALRSRNVPYIQHLVFCSARDQVVHLAPDARNFICVCDSDDKSRPGICAALFRRQGPGLRPATERLPANPRILRHLGESNGRTPLRQQSK